MFMYGTKYDIHCTSIIIILVFRVCVCVLVISEFSGTGRPSDTPLSPTWRAPLASCNDCISSQQDPCFERESL